MYPYFFRTLIVLVFSLVTIFCYYFLFPFHIESSSILPLYAWIIVFLYVCYKFFYIGLGYEKVVFSPVSIVLYSILHLCILSFLFFYANGSSWIYTLALTWKIIFFTGIISVLFLIIVGFWNKILDTLVPDFSGFRTSFQSVFSLWVWLSIFLFLLSIVAVLNLYTVWSVLAIIWVFCVVGYESILKYISWFFSARFSFENHDVSREGFIPSIRPYLLSTEFLFILVTWIISVNCINIVRPFPIGWDDLWVYMNYPKLIASHWWNLALGTMYEWQLYTGIGFLFKSQNFAFFLNSFSAILSFFALYLWIKSFSPQDKKTTLNLPFLSATIFTALPMVIFQMSKDMKLDIGLFALSFIALIGFYIVFTRYTELSKKQRNTIILLWGCILWVTFSIKITSLLLISGIIALIFYHFFRIWGFVAYVLVYIGIFTFFGLWDFMNVVYPQGNSQFVSSVSIVSFSLGVAALVYGFLKYQKNTPWDFFTILSLVILWIMIPLVPWQIKNISELDGDPITMSRILWGNADRFTPDYSLIYSPDELVQREQSLESLSLTHSGSVQNEDFWRYFGYEQWINNYLKLPWNLTMQTNQKWEFTDISYIFFALLPALFLFLPYRKRAYYIPVIAVLIFELLYFLPTPVGASLTSFFGQIFVPIGYLFLLIPMLLSAIYLYHTLDKTQRISKIFLLNFVFCSFYVFLWTISAFGIVWYGIVMYGAFLFAIHLCLQPLAIYDDTTQNQHNDFRWVSLFIVFCVIFTYFVQSSIPHYLNNLTSAWYVEYKKWQITENQALFKMRPSYLSILFALNIDDSKKQLFLDTYKLQTAQVIQDIPWGTSQKMLQFVQKAENITVLDYFLSEASVPSTDDSPEIKNTKKQLQFIQSSLYNDILSPPDDLISTVGIFRAGTFLKYYITDNYKRLQEDSLLTSFDTYYFDEAYPVTFERMKQVWLEYVLVDLNAATIDNDPRKDLTRRYENLLKSFTASNISLIESDSFCLKAGLDYFRRTWDMDGYLKLAGINYSTQSETKTDKFANCKKYIQNIIVTKDVIGDDYRYLIPLHNNIISRWWDTSNPEHVQTFVSKYIIYGQKALFEIQ